MRNYSELKEVVEIIGTCGNDIESYLSDVLIEYTDYLGTGSEIVKQDPTWDRGIRKAVREISHKLADEALGFDPDESEETEELERNYSKLSDLVTDLGWSMEGEEPWWYIHNLLLAVAERYMGADMEIIEQDQTWEPAVDMIYETMRSGFRARM